MRPHWTALLIVGLVVASGCGQTTIVKTVTVSEPAAAPRAHEQPAPRRPSPPVRRTPVFVSCDRNISVKAATTTCGFAQNAFFEYWRDPAAPSLSVLSPALGRWLDTACSPAGGVVRCTTGDGGAVHFPERAVNAYTPEMAKAFASAHGLDLPEYPSANIDLERLRDQIEKDDAALDQALEDLDREYPDPDWEIEGLPELSEVPDIADLPDLPRYPASSGFGGINAAGFPKNQYVRGYTRSDGTQVSGYWRNSPQDGLPTCKITRC